MLPDAISIFALMYVLIKYKEKDTLTYSIIECFVFFKQYRIFYLLKFFESNIMLYGTKAHFYKLGKMLVVILILCHWVGCFYHLLA